MGLLRRRRSAPASTVGFTKRATPDASDRLRSLGATVYVVEDAKVLTRQYLSQRRKP